MFTVKAIELAHAEVKSGADFPKYIQALTQMGVLTFETWVQDSHTEYMGAAGFSTQSEAQYEPLAIAENCNKKLFISYLKSHQGGESDYETFCKQCAETGIDKWRMDLKAMTCTYYSKAGHEILIENIPA